MGLPLSGENVIYNTPIIQLFSVSEYLSKNKLWCLCWTLNLNADHNNETMFPQVKPILTLYSFHYTQSQRKCSITSLASPVTQGQGQVTPAGLYFVTYFKQVAKNPIKNIMKSSRVCCVLE